MALLVECPRCDKPLPLEAVFCRRCGLALRHRRVMPHAASPVGWRRRRRESRPSVNRLAALIIVGLCVALFAALATRPSPRSGYPYPYRGYGGGGGGGGGIPTPVFTPSSPLDNGPDVPTAPPWRTPRYSQPPRHAPEAGRRNGRPNTYGPGRNWQYSNPYAPPQPGSPAPGYGTPGRGPGR